jgi:hypothetical protein
MSDKTPHKHEAEMAEATDDQTDEQDEIEVIGSIPNRPLTGSEIVALTTADDIVAVEKTAHLTGTNKVIGAIIATKSGHVGIGYHPQRCRWEAIERSDVTHE